MEGILGGKIVAAGDVVLIRYEGPEGRPRHAGDAVSHQLPEIEGHGEGLRARHRRSVLRRVSGLSIGHISPEAAEGGTIGLVEDGDRIEIDIPARTLHLAVDDAELARRRAAMQARGPDAWQPAPRKRNVTQALKAYAALTTSASRGAVRDVGQLRR